MVKKKIKIFFNKSSNNIKEDQFQSSAMIIFISFILVLIPHSSLFFSLFCFLFFLLHSFLISPFFTSLFTPFSFLFSYPFFSLPPSSYFTVSNRLDKKRRRKKEGKENVKKFTKKKGKIISKENFLFVCINLLQLISLFFFFFSLTFHLLPCLQLTSVALKVKLDGLMLVCCSSKSNIRIFLSSHDNADDNNKQHIPCCSNLGERQQHKKRESLMAHFHLLYRWMMRSM